MQIRPYGKTGTSVSLLGLGCMRLPRIPGTEGTVDEEKAFELIRYASDHGITYFDTAFGYHRGNSESVLGEALEGQRRKNSFIATKQPFGAMTTQGDIRKNLEATLKKLRTDWIDVYLIHNIGAHCWEGIQQRKIIEEYEKFRSEGLIRNIGFSYHGGYPLFHEVLNSYDWDMAQVQHNLLDTNKEVTVQGIEDAGKKGCALVIMEPLRGGGLATPPKVVRDVYASASVSRSGIDWAFRYLANFPQVSSILSGMSTLEQLKENIKIFSATDLTPSSLSNTDTDMLVRAKAAYESIVTIPCTGCEYCLPCPQNVSIPQIFKLVNDGHMFENMQIPARSYMFTTKSGRDVSKCVSCGVCLEKCPQKIQIPQELAQAHEVLKGYVE